MIRQWFKGSILKKTKIMQFCIKTTVLGCIFLCISTFSNSQTTTIDFSRAPYNAGARPDELAEFYKPGGCWTYHNFGPNPLPLNGHNVRVVGSTWLALLWPMNALNLYAFDKGVGSYFNAALSIEYPFQANKTYEIEIHGGLDHGVWLEGTTQPNNYINAVFWLKLDNNPEIVSSATNKCESSYTPVEKSVNRYSKLIADGNREINSRIYKVKFSPLENRNALKITYDPSPMDPALRFDEIFRLWFVNITEMPYEEETRSVPSYTNAPRPPRGSPYYNIEYTSDIKPAPHQGRLFSREFSIPTEKWKLDYNKETYSVYLSDIMPKMDIDIENLYIKGNLIQSPRGTYNENISLPGSFKNITYRFELINDDLVIISPNISNSPPENINEFVLTYYLKN
jgi:hypothetical protein